MEKFKSVSNAQDKKGLMSCAHLKHILTSRTGSNVYISYNVHKCLVLCYNGQNNTSVISTGHRDFQKYLDENLFMIIISKECGRNVLTLFCMSVCRGLEVVGSNPTVEFLTKFIYAA